MEKVKHLLKNECMLYTSRSSKIAKPTPPTSALIPTKVPKQVPMYLPSSIHSARVTKLAIIENHTLFFGALQMEAPCFSVFTISENRVCVYGIIR